METEELYERRLYRENFLEAKTVIEARESKFTAAVTQALQYGVGANAAAIATLIGFVGTVGKDVTNSHVLICIFLPFGLGVLCAGTALLFNVLNHERNLRESITSFLSAAQARDISKFNDQHNGRTKLDTAIRLWLSGAFSFFIAGLLIAGFVFPALEWKEDPVGGQDQSEFRLHETEQGHGSSTGEFFPETGAMGVSPPAQAESQGEDQSAAP